jgi:hypothetical protein
MSVTVAPTRSWIHTHRAALAIVLLSMALAATLGLLAARLVVPGAVPIAPTSVTGVHLEPTDNGCQVARPGQPC